MADAVTTQIILNTSKRLVLLFTCISNGGETGVEKVVPATYNCSDFVINKVQFQVTGMRVNILWDADTDAVALVIGASSGGTGGDFIGIAGSFDFGEYGGLVNAKAANYTGKILFTTVGHTIGDSYSILLELEKVP